MNIVNSRIFQGLPRPDCHGQILQPVGGTRRPEPLGNRRRKQEDAAGKNGRYHAGHVHFQRQVRALGLVHLATLLALRVIDRDTPLAPLDKYDHVDHGDRNREDRQQNEDIDLALPGLLQGLADRRRQARDDAGEDQQGDPVADTFLRDLLAQPHHEHGTGDQGSNRNHEKHDAGVVAHSLIGHARGHARRLDYREHNGQVARVLAYLAATRLTFLLELFQAAVLPPTSAA
jgi:hypothetical protein